MAAAAGSQPARAACTARETATFEPYYWEAYNEIVRPDRFDRYLIDRWLPDLGPLGFALLKALRRRCYHNPKEGTTRSAVEVEVAELAAAVGVHTATVYRELERNETLGHFIQVQHQYAAAGPGKAPRRHAPQFTVCMDDPIHPLDRERYDELRARKECDRAAAADAEVRKFRMKPAPAPAPVTAAAATAATEGTNAAGAPKSQIANKASAPKSQIAITGGTKSQSANPQSQIANPESQFATDAPYSNSLPPDSIPMDSLPPAAGRTPPQSDPQGGEEKSAGETLQGDPLPRAWDRALRSLATLVNKPTFEAHLRPLRPGAWDEAAGEVEILCPSAFTREWIAKRHGDQIAALLAEALGRESIALRLTAPGK